VETSVRFAARNLGGDAGFLAPRLGGRGVTLGDGEFRADVVVPQFEQHLPGLHAVAFLHRQARNLAAGGRRELGALAGLDRAGTRIGHRLRDTAAGRLDHLDGDRLRAPEPQRRADADGREAGKDPDRAPLHAESPASSAARLQHPAPASAIRDVRAA
jgi:hypothetical protein